LDASHTAVPVAEVGVGGGEPVTARVKEIAQHPEKVEIDETRPLIEQKGFPHKHFFEGDKALGQFREELLLLCPPLIEASAPEFPFFVAQKRELLGRRNQLLPVDIIEPEARTLNLVFDAAPQERLDALEFPRKQPEAQLVVEILGDHLGVVIDLEDDRFAVTDNRDPVIAVPSEFPDEGTIGVGNIDDFETGAREFEDAVLDNAKRAPGELNQFDHVVLGIRFTTALL
jgi:hypothetical protein